MIEVQKLAELDGLSDLEALPERSGYGTAFRIFGNLGYSVPNGMGWRRQEKPFTTKYQGGGGSDLDLFFRTGVGGCPETMGEFLEEMTQRYKANILAFAPTPGGSFALNNVCSMADSVAHMKAQTESVSKGSDSLRIGLGFSKGAADMMGYCADPEVNMDGMVSIAGLCREPNIRDSRLTRLLFTGALVDEVVGKNSYLHRVGQGLLNRDGFKMCHLITEKDRVFSPGEQFVEGNEKDSFLMRGLGHFAIMDQPNHVLIGVERALKEITSQK